MDIEWLFPTAARLEFLKHLIYLPQIRYLVKRSNLIEVKQIKWQWCTCLETQFLVVKPKNHKSGDTQVFALHVCHLKSLFLELLLESLFAYLRVKCQDLTSRSRVKVRPYLPFLVSQNTKQDVWSGNMRLCSSPSDSSSPCLFPVMG